MRKLDTTSSPSVRRPAGRREALVPNPKAALREQLHEGLRFCHYSRRTEEAYWQRVVRFLRCHRDSSFQTGLPTKPGGAAPPLPAIK